MAISPAAQTMNRSSHSITELKNFAQASAPEAEAYLRAVEAKLTAAGATSAAGAIEAVLAATGDLVARIDAQAAQLGLVFPATNGGFGALQQARAATVGWVAAPQAETTPVRITGQVSKSTTGALQLTTDSGRTLNIAGSSHNIGNLGAGLLSGFAGDGPVTLEGTLSATGDTFNVEGFALNKDGRYDTFTFARVAVDPTLQTVVLTTPRGNVEIDDATLKAKMQAMPKLGVILPGAPEKRPDGTMHYTGNPETFFGLGRFMAAAALPADANAPAKYVPCDMAYSSFNKKPMTLPAEAEARIISNGRFFAEGSLTLGADGVATRFDAGYVSQGVDGTWLTAGQDADPIMQAVVLTDAGAV